MRLILTLLFTLAASASAIADDASHTAAAKELLEVTRAAEIIDQVYDSMEGQFDNMAEQLGITEDQRPIFDRHMERVFQVMREEMNWEKMEPYMVSAYAQVYTEQELRELIEFYQSPLGQKFLAKMPELMNVSMATTQELMSGFYDRLGELQAEFEAELAASKEGS